MHKGISIFLMIAINKISMGLIEKELAWCCFEKLKHIYSP
jgi:hypothetical protein